MGGGYYTPEQEREHEARVRKITDDDTSEFELGPIRPPSRRARRAAGGMSTARASEPTPAPEAEQDSGGSTLASVRPKIQAAALAGAITTVLVYTLNETLAFDPPPPVVAALTTVIAVIAGYLQPDE